MLLLQVFYRCHCQTKWTCCKARGLISSALTRLFAASPTKAPSSLLTISSALKRSRRNLEFRRAWTRFHENWRRKWRRWWWRMKSMSLWKPSCCWIQVKMSVVVDVCLQCLHGTEILSVYPDKWLRQWILVKRTWVQFSLSLVVQEQHLGRIASLWEKFHVAPMPNQKTTNEMK